MPTYAYRCAACGYAFDAKQSFSEAALSDCPECGAAGTLRKQFGNVGVVFKGSGFYRNDSRTDSGSSSSSSTSKGSKDSGTKSSSSKSSSSTDSGSGTSKESSSSTGSSSSSSASGSSGKAASSAA